MERHPSAAPTTPTWGTSSRELALGHKNKHIKDIICDVSALKEQYVRINHPSNTYLEQVSITGQAVCH